MQDAEIVTSYEQLVQQHIVNSFLLLAVLCRYQLDLELDKKMSAQCWHICAAVCLELENPDTDLYLWAFGLKIVALVTRALCRVFLPLLVTSYDPYGKLVRGCAILQ